MAKMLRCRDVGMDCDFEARAETEDDLLEKVVEHAKTEHGMSEISPDIVVKVKAAIREV